MAGTVNRDPSVQVASTAEPPAGDESFAAIYRRYKGTLTNYAYRRGASDPEAAANMALFDGFRALPRMEDRSDAALGAYLHRATLGYAAKDNYDRHPVPTEFEDDALIQVDPTEQLLNRAWVAELVEQLPPDQRHVIESRFFLGLSGQETGERLGKDPNAVYQLQHRALRRLRRAAFAAILVVLIAVGAVIIRQGTNSSTDVDNSPVDQSIDDQQSRDPNPATSTSTPAQTLIGDSEVSGGETSDENDGDARLVSEDTGPDAAERPSTTVEDQPGDAAAEPEPAESSDEQVTSTTASPPTSRDRPEPSTPIVPVAPATPLTDCAPQQLSATLMNFKLYNTASNSDLAARFIQPEAVRFLDPDGRVLHTIDTSGPMRTSSAANSHGWIGAADGSGTYANYDDAPARRYWGLLVNTADITGWASLETLDPATTTWSAFQACSA